MDKLLRIIFSTLFLLLFLPATSQNIPQLEWAKQFGGTQIGSGDLVAVDASGNVYTYGTFKGTVDFDPGPADYSLTSAGMTDLFISKLDASGNFVWAKRIGGSNNEEGSFTIDDLGNVYLTGTFKGTINIDPNLGVFTSTYRDIFIAKLNPSGDFVWAKQIQGTGQEMSTSIEVDASGNIYALGNYQGGTIDFDPGPGVFDHSSIGDTMFISKYDSSGNFIWAKRFEDDSIAFFRSITTDFSGNIYATGFFSGTVDFDPGTGTSILSTPDTGDFDIFVLKLDSSGSFLWVNQMGGAAQNNDEAFDIFVDSSNNVYTTGYFEGTSDFDPGTGTYNLTSSGFRDVFICKLDSAGGFIWAKGFGGSDKDVGRGLSLDPAGNIYVTGRFEGTADFDPGTGTNNLTSAGDYDIFINKLDNTGNFLSAYQMGGENGATGKSIAINALNDIYLTGAFSNTVDFDPGPATFNLVSEVVEAFVLKLNDNLSIQENSLNQDIQIYPNPVSESLIISSKYSKIEQVQIYDLQGRKVLEEKLNALNASLNLKNLTSGIYIAEITAGGKMISHRIVKE